MQKGQISCSQVFIILLQSCPAFNYVFSYRNPIYRFCIFIQKSCLLVLHFHIEIMFTGPAFSYRNHVYKFLHFCIIQKTCLQVLHFITLHIIQITCLYDFLNSAYAYITWQTCSQVLITNNILDTMPIGLLHFYFDYKRFLNQ